MAGDANAAGVTGTGGGPACTTDAECDDSNACTDDACVDGVCAFLNNTVTCDDDNECTDDDACVDAACVGTPNAIVCDDLSSCTSDDKCGEGECNGEKDLVRCPSCVRGDNLLQNCDFADGGTHWVNGFTDGAGTQVVRNQRLIVDIVESGVESDDVQPRVEGLTLLQGMKYRLTLVAGASVARTIQVKLLQWAAPHRVYASIDAQLEPQMKPFGGEFVVRDLVDNNAVLELLLGGTADNPSRVYVDDVVLEELPCGADKECDDASACTLDACDLVAGSCSWTNTGAACTDDGNDCTADVCIAGACAHKPLTDDVPCGADADACTLDACVNGACQHVFDTGVCACTLGKHCEDHNPCTDDTCNAGACEYAANTAGCDDRNACTTNDSCDGGTCAGASNVDSCDDGDVCTVEDACNSSFCEAGRYVCLDCSAEPNLVSNCDFAAGEAGWLRGFFGAATGAQRVEQGLLVVDIKSGGVDATQVLPRQEGVLLTEGQTYVVSLNAKASRSRQLGVAVARSGGDHQAYSPPQTFQLTQQLDRFSFEFTMNEPAPAEGARFELLLGGPDDNASPNTVWVDNVLVSPKP